MFYCREIDPGWCDKKTNKYKTKTRSDNFIDLFYLYAKQLKTIKNVKIFPVSLMSENKGI